MNVFILCSGRSGSMSFIKACSHFSNFSAGHETLVNKLGDERFAYPPNHIEADNRLSWLLGRLDEHYGDEAFYVHLIRDRMKTAESFNRRWDLREGIIKAYTEGILMESREKGLPYCLDYYDTVHANIRYFLKNKTHKMTIHLEQIEDDFVTFARTVGAEGDLDLALKEFQTRHNASQKESWLGRLFGKLKR